MKVIKLPAFSKAKATVFMDEKAALQEDREKAIISTIHEIRSPLTAIKLANQLMQEAYEKEEHSNLLMQSYMTLITQNVERIEKNIREAMTYKPREPMLEVVNISDCLDRAIYEAQDRLFLSGINMNNNYWGNHWVNGDAEKLTRAFLNIIVNAIEAIKSDNGKIWISVHDVNNSLRVTFKDNGVGMEQYVAEKIFDPDFSTKDGIGIGLYSVKEIMHFHKAHIVADSLLGVGTSISMLFNKVPEDGIKK